LPTQRVEVKIQLMAEGIQFSSTAPREQLYSEIKPQIEALIAGERDLIANLANVSAVLKEAFGFFWVGFYLAKDNELVLGPFQGPLACTRIEFDQGVCGHAYTTRKTVIVPNVDEFPGHIACSTAAKSEIVVPIIESGEKVFGVLDVDSDKLNDFSDIDRLGLERIVEVIERFIRSHTNSERIE
jgi:L-methionine (R)-S-oxide reductase